MQIDFYARKMYGKSLNLTTGIANIKCVITFATSVGQIKNMTNK